MSRAVAPLEPAPRTGHPDDLLRREGAGLRRAPRREHRCSDGDRLTLERKLASVWEGLLVAGAAECPVCRGRMEREGAAGRCTRCGSRLG